MTILFPPVLESLGPAIPFQVEDETPFMSIRFPMPIMVKREDIKHLQVSIKYASTGEPAVNPAYSPDNQTLFIQGTASAYFYQENNGNYVIKVPYYCFKNGQPLKNNTYLVQVRFGSNYLWGARTKTGLERNDFAAFADWRQNSVTNIPTTFGEWSNIQKVYCYEPTPPTISWNAADFMPEIVLTYAPTGDDPIEQVKVVYNYYGLDKPIYRSEVFNGQYNDDNVFTARQKLPIAPFSTIAVSVEAVTKNNVVYGDILTIPSFLNNHGQMPVGRGTISDTVLAPEEQEDGVLAKTVKLPNITTIKYNIYRVETLSLKCIKILEDQELVRGETLTFKDFTVEMGVDYQYVIGVLTDGEVTSMLTNPYPFGPSNPAYGRLMRMDSSYLTTRGHQLRLQGNVSLTSLKKNTQDTFQTTIGSKYPFYTRPSNMGYRTFSLSGVVSVNFDPTATFLRIDHIETLSLNSRISQSEYRLLMEASPGLEKYFIGDYTTNPMTYRIVVPNGLDPAETIALINRCANSLIKNGMWWDDDNGDSELIVQDRDLLTTQDFSLSRVRQFSDQGDKFVGMDSIDPWEGRGPSSRYSEFLHRETTLAYGTNPTDSLVFVERKFREKVMDWLGDGKPKLFRSETEGNMIVIVSGVSFSPLDKTSRMVYTVSMTVTEIAEFNSENLKLYNLIPTYIKSFYAGVNPYQFVPGKYDEQMVTKLIYEYSQTYDIPDMMIDDASNYFSVDTSKTVKNKKGTLRFTASGLPNGLYITSKGVLQGYPMNIADTLRPGTAVLTVTDEYVQANPDGSREIKTQTASITISWGYMYKKLIAKNPSLPLYIASPNGFTVGEAIPEIDIPLYFTGGVGPFTYSGQNLPSGIGVTSEGVITGHYGSVTDRNYDEATGELLPSANAQVTIKDAMGQVLVLKVKFDTGTYALSFIHLPSFDYDYTEVNTLIPWVDVTRGVIGGKDGDPATYTYSKGDGWPKGWNLSDGTHRQTNPDGTVSIVPNGTIWGTPEEETDANGVFTVKVTDKVGTTKEIQISYQRILGEFKFEYSRAFDVRNRESISIGTTIEQIDVTKGVSGGLQFGGQNKYEFWAEGLAPNFAITKGGIIYGTALTAKSQMNVANIYVRDARGEERVVSGRDPVLVGDSPTPGSNTGVIVSDITADLETDINRIVISGLREGKALENANVLVYAKNGTYHNIQSGFFKPDKDRKYLSILSFSYNGISIVPVPAASGDYIDSWKFTGTPLAASSQIETRLSVQNNLTKVVLEIPITIEECLGILKWPYPTGQTQGATLSPEVDTSFDYLLSTAIIGGEGPYRVELQEALNEDTGTKITDNWIQTIKIENPVSSSNKSGWHITGQTPDVNINKTRLRFKVYSNDGQEAMYEVLINKNVKSLSIAINDIQKIANTVLIKGFSKLENVPLLVGSGGVQDGVTKTYFGNTSLQTDGNGNMILVPGVIIDRETGKVSGVPTDNGAVGLDVAKSFYITQDLTDEKARTYIRTGSWKVPRVIEKPDFNPALASDSHFEKLGTVGNRESGKYTVPFLDTGTNYVSSAIFINSYSLLTSIISEKNFPDGLTFNERNDINGVYGYVINGEPQSFSAITAKRTFSVAATTFSPAYEREVTIVFQGVPVLLSIKVSKNSVGPYGKGKNVSEVIGLVTGGTKDFDIVTTGVPKGLEIKLDSDGETLLLIGAPEEVSDATAMTFYIYDNGTEKASGTYTINYGGTYEPIQIDSSKLTNLIIPDTKSGDSVNVDLSTLGIVSKGKPYTDGTYVWQAVDNTLGSRGYELLDSGLISGESANQSFAAGEAQIKVIDSVGQEEVFTIKIGKITGPLAYVGATEYTGDGTLPLGPGGTAGASLTNTSVDLSNYFVGIGAETVEVKKSTDKKSIFEKMDGSYSVSGRKVTFSKLPKIALEADGMQNCIDNLYYEKQENGQTWQIGIKLFHKKVTSTKLWFVGTENYETALEWQKFSGGASKQAVSGENYTRDLKSAFSGSGADTAKLVKSTTKSKFEVAGGEYEVSGTTVKITKLPDGYFAAGSANAAIDNLYVCPASYTGTAPTTANGAKAILFFGQIGVQPET